LSLWHNQSEQLFQRRGAELDCSVVGSRNATIKSLRLVGSENRKRIKEGKGRSRNGESVRHSRTGYTCYLAIKYDALLNLGKIFAMLMGPLAPSIPEIDPH
jgi:hypothetical protein